MPVLDGKKANAVHKILINPPSAGGFIFPGVL